MKEASPQFLFFYFTSALDNVFGAFGFGEFIVFKAWLSSEESFDSEMLEASFHSHTVSVGEGLFRFRGVVAFTGERNEVFSERPSLWILRAL